MPWTYLPKSLARRTSTGALSTETKSATSDGSARARVMAVLAPLAMEMSGGISNTRSMARSGRGEPAARKSLHGVADERCLLQLVLVDKGSDVFRHGHVRVFGRVR